MSIAPLLILLVALPVATDERPLPERWTLEHLPGALPNLPESLFDTTWGHLPPRSRTGRGHSVFLTFRRSRGAESAEVEWRQIVHRSAGKPDQEQSRTLPLRVEKSLLEFGGSLRTAVVHDDVLILNAGVPVGDRTWYLVFSETFSDDRIRVQEYLFEFGDDPRTVDSGRVVVQHASNVFPDHKPKKWTQSATFTIDKTRDGYRTFVLKSLTEDAKSRTNLPRFLLRTDRPYLALNEPHEAVIEYRPQK